MRIDILTLFPEMFAPLKESIIGRAVNSGKLEIVITDIRDFADNKHRRCDDYPFGGGAGMVMMPQPIASAVKFVDPEHQALRIYMSPKGKTFHQNMIKSLIEHERILLLCGHYEGVDQRVLDLYFDDEISIGDYVLTGGELPAMVVADALSRYVDGVISSESLSQESFTENRLEYPQFTRPSVFEDVAVPEVLLNGNHAKINEWREQESKRITLKNRPDLLEKN